MFGTAMVMVLAAAQPSAPELQGPPSPTPLTAQGAATPPAPGGALAKSSPQPSAKTETLQPPAAAGQSASGVTPYAASFFVPFQPNTAMDMVNRLPGFVFDDGDSVRGFAGAAGNVLIDGQRPTSKSDDLYSVLKRIPASQVERIDIIRGAAPGIDMQGKTVIANVIRKADTGVTGVFTLSNSYLPADGRQIPGARIELADRRNGKSLEGSVQIASFDDDGAGDGPEVTTAPGQVRLDKQKDNTAAGGVQAIVTGAYTTPAFGGTFRANTQLFGQTYIYDERDQDVPTPSEQPTLEHDHQNREQSEVGLTYDRSFGAKLSTETLYIQQFQAEDYLTLFTEPGETDRFREGHVNGESILRSTATYAYAKTLTFEAGGEIDYNWLDSRTTYLSNGALVLLPAANVDVTETRGEGFAKGTWVISPQFTLEAGLRLEASHIASRGDVVLDKTLVYPKPRAVLTWSPDKADQFRFRVEEEVSQLDFNNFIATTALTTGEIYAGNPNLTPQQALVLEAAYERRFWTSGDLTLTYRHSGLTDVIDRAPILNPSGDYDAPANIGGGTEDDLITAFTVPIDRFGVPGATIKGNVTWRNTSVKDPTTGQERPISGLRPREGEIDFNQDLPQWKISWGATYNLGWRQPYYRFSEIEVDSFRQYGTAFIEYKPKLNLSLKAEVDDIGADFRRTLEVYPDLRSTTAQEDTDVRDLYFGPSIYFRVRQSF
jgi:hypothetical protein